VPKLLANLPFFDHSEVFFLSVQSRLRFVTIQHRQIPVRISLRASASLPAIPSAYSFPAILDTGFNGVLAISTYHLRAWAGLTPEALGPLRSTPIQTPSAWIRGIPAEIRDTQIWIRRNVNGSWDDAGESPVEFKCPGIFVVQSEPTAPNSEPELRLPLLGMRALEQPGKKSRLEIDFSARRVQLRA